MFAPLGRLAQLEEHLVYTEGVASSSLAPPTNKNNDLAVWSKHLAPETAPETNKSLFKLALLD